MGEIIARLVTCLRCGEKHPGGMYPPHDCITFRLEERRN